jgi:hypothetical protein
VIGVGLRQIELGEDAVGRATKPMGRAHNGHDGVSSPCTHEDFAHRGQRNPAGASGTPPVRVADDRGSAGPAYVIKVIIPGRGRCKTCAGAGPGSSDQPVAP